MTPQESAVLTRIEDKIDELFKEVTALVVKEAHLEKTVSKQEEDLSALKAAHNKALGILTFLTFPGVALTLWMGLQLYMKKP
jgi:hypothetical protein